MATDIAGERARLAEQGLQITYREAWGALQDYTSDRTVNRPAQWLFLHITVTDDPADTPAAEAAACLQVEAIGQERFGIGWSYNAGVMQSGRLYEGQPLTRRGAHTVNDLPNHAFPSGSLNYDVRGLALVQDVEDAVTDAQIDSAARWGAALRRSGEAIVNARWYGHRDVTAKSCPGDIAYARLAELNALTDHYTTVGLSGVTPAFGGLDVMSLTNQPGTGWVNLVIVGQDNAAYHYSAPNVEALADAKKEHLGGAVTAVTCAWSGNTLIVIGKGADDDKMYTKYWRNGVWSSWFNAPVDGLVGPAPTPEEPLAEG